MAKDRDDTSLRHWYASLHSRKVDLVGDYAGAELFLVEGDSLLLDAFSDAYLDFGPTAFQLLHASYNVEIFLKRLISRNCNFHLVFFDDHEHMCLPSSTDEVSREKYLLARATIIRHLQRNVDDNLVRTHRFESIKSPAFLDYLNRAGCYFVMCNDGSDANVENKARFLWMIHWIIQRGWNVALTNGLECHDTKIMAMVLEGKPQDKDFTISPIARSDRVNGLKSSNRAEIVQVLHSTCSSMNAHISEREAITLICLRELFLEGSMKPVDTSRILLHTASLAHIPLAARQFASVAPNDLSNPFTDFVLCARKLLTDSSLTTRLDDYELPCDLSDYADGRLFFALGQADEESLQTLLAEEGLVAKRHTLLGSLFTQLLHNYDKKQCRLENPPGSFQNLSQSRGPEFVDAAHVWHFEHPVFDQHLKPIHVIANSKSDDHKPKTGSKIFNEATHWHNAQKPLVAKGHHVEKVNYWAHKRNQYFMAEMKAYAASLTNAAGKILDPETIIVKDNAASRKKETNIPTREKPAKEGGKLGGKPGGNSGGKAGQGTKKGGRESALAEAAAIKAAKGEQEDSKFHAAWDTACRDILKEEELVEQYLKAEKYFNSLPKKAENTVGPEVQLFKIGTLYAIWSKWTSQEGKSSTDMARLNGYIAIIWDIASTLSRNNTGLTLATSKAINDILTGSSLPTLNFTASKQDRKLPFKLPKITPSSKSKQVDPSPADPQRFQLEYCGPYFDRSFDAANDSRVPFQPDGWQRKVLDAIDRQRSLLVIAPTSAGKTFISFYAMKQVLESSDDDVLVYVAPTKALVNQIAAEIQARFSKTLKHAGRSVWGIHTRDYRINNPTGCQVLVTVPHILQIMLLSPSHAEKKSSWSNRIRRIIFDEVHCIGQADDGLIWEQLLLLAPCPIIALSATVGNPGALASWLKDTQKALGNDFITIQHKTRYSDLRKFIYNAPETFEFVALRDSANVPTPGLDGPPAFSFVHPVASLIDRARGIPEDLSLEPRDCLTLYKSLSKFQTKEFPISTSLDPAKALPTIIKKSDILKWEADLKEILTTWMDDPHSPFDRVLEDLSQSATDKKSFKIEGTNRLRPSQRDSNASYILKTTLPLLVDLHAKDALPAIIFNFDRAACEDITKTIMSELMKAETKWKDASAVWQKKMAAWEEWKTIKEKAAEKAKKSSTKDKAKKKKGKGDDDDEEPDVKFDDLKDSESDPMARFDPLVPLDGFHFADWRKLLPSEFRDDYTKELRRRGVPEWLMNALKRGIGVHHAGMNRKYRQAVEILFRKGFLRVVVATGTLALGINMPCKSVVFSGDSVFLTALNFRQAAGRAGRRGFDVLGNVVFQGITFSKVCRLLSSRLPDLNGHFPITTSLVLRLLTLLHETKSGDYATKAVNALLSQPRLYLGGAGGQEAKMTVLHHLRFSIEYLRRQDILGPKGEPLNFAGLVSHLYYTENSGFAFHALLKGGYFHDLCADIDHQPKRVLLELMLTLSHIFGRLELRRADEDFVRLTVKPSTSVVFLPPMPAAAKKILKAHNEDTLHVYRTYVSTFVDQHLKSADKSLPLSGIPIGPDMKGNEPGLFLSTAVQPVRLRSPFVALSGHDDRFSSIHDLCSTIRDGVFLEENVIPHVPIESNTPLNAYLYDYYKHGDIHTLVNANKIPRGNSWFLLNDFSLVLATIIASIKNFMGMTEGDEDFENVRGSGDAADEMAGDKSADEDESDVPGVNDRQGGVGGSLPNVLRALVELKKEFDEKFKLMWA